jgi:hypothetical protein
LPAGVGRGVDGSRWYVVKAQVSSRLIHLTWRQVSDVEFMDRVEAAKINFVVVKISLGSSRLVYPLVSSRIRAETARCSFFFVR